MAGDKSLPESEMTVGFQQQRHDNAAPSVPPGETETRRQVALKRNPNGGNDDISQDQFDQLLRWLNPDREQAATKYEWIRKRLIKIFASRGCHTPEELADATMNRVARKLPEIHDTYIGDPAYYFCSVASYIWREWLRRDKVPAVAPPLPSAQTEEKELDFRCLEKCLNQLSRSDRDLAIAYYQQEKHAKIDHRKKLAEEMGVAMNALRIRAHRIRTQLSKCVALCRAESG